MTTQKPVPGTGGDHYIPYAQRSGVESVVYFTRDFPMHNAAVWNPLFTLRAIYPPKGC